MIITQASLELQAKAELSVPASIMNCLLSYELKFLGDLGPVGDNIFIFSYSAFAFSQCLRSSVY